MSLDEQDLLKIKELMHPVFDTVMLQMKSIENRLQESIANLPTKEEYFTQADAIVTKLNKIETEQIAITHRLNENTSDIEVLQEKFNLIQSKK